MGGQEQLFSEKLHVGRPNLGDRGRMLARFEDVLDRRWLTNDGPYVRAFEQEIAARLGVRHCVAVSSATSGLQIAIRSLGLAGEVIVPSFTFPATVHALAWQGITPVFCDIDPKSHNIDPDKIERLIGPRVTGILGVHLWGNPCAVEALADVAERRGLALLYDAAHAFGCSHIGRMIGNFGNAEVFSFHATKFVNAGEGGAVVTNDDDLAAKLRSLRAFGFVGDQIADVGLNAKMSEFAAVVGLTSLESSEEFVDWNQGNLIAYQDVLSGVSGLRLLFPGAREKHNAQYVVVDVEQSEFGMSRDEILTALHSQNVIAKRYFYPGCHRIPPYRTMPGAVRLALPHTERLCNRLLQLPTGTTVGPQDIARIGEFLRGLTSLRRRAA